MHCDCMRETETQDTSIGTGKLCILGHLGLVFIWSCFVFCLLFLLFYVSLRNLCSGTCRKIRNSEEQGPRIKHQRYDISRLQDPVTKSTFVLLLRKSFYALSYIDEPEDEEEDAVNRQWKRVEHL